MSESRKYTQAQKISAKKWDAANLDRISVALPKGQKDVVKAHAEGQGESVNGFINRAIVETIQRDSGAPAAPEMPTPAAEGAAHDPPQTAHAAGQAGDSVGGVALGPNALATAQQAAERTGEGVAAFVERAVEQQAQRDESLIRMGLRPAVKVAPDGADPAQEPEHG